MFIDKNTLASALEALYGSAGHFLKIWFTIKHMGMAVGSPPIEIDTSNSKPSLERLFSCGHPDNAFYIPFAHTQNRMTINEESPRSIIQTTIRRWATSDSVVTCNPTSYIDIKESSNKKLLVATGKKYPEGLGFGENGFARGENLRVQIPLQAFAVWYGRNTPIPEDCDPEKWLIDLMLKELNIDSHERELIFVDSPMPIKLQTKVMTNDDIYSLCRPFIEGDKSPKLELIQETLPTYTRRVRSMASGLDLPVWMRTPPSDLLQYLIQTGAKAILLFGPPRTGKTRSIDLLVPRDSAERCTIQIHDGWGYDNLMEALYPCADNEWKWQSGPLKYAINSGKKYIVLEEINRTQLSQSLGEVFSLLEEDYRGEKNAIILRSGERFWIPSDVVFIMTMNTLDKSTEEIDDALWGRVAAIEYPPRAEDLNNLLTTKGVSTDIKEKILKFYAGILEVYPLGQGYFANIHKTAGDTEFLKYYLTKIRPVIKSNLGKLRMHDLEQIDNIADSLFTYN